VITVLRLDGMLAVHSARAAFAALAAWMESASRRQVGRAEIEHDAPLNLDAVRAARVSGRSAHRGDD
jgi:hypothetical protein